MKTVAELGAALVLAAVVAAPPVGAAPPDGQLRDAIKASIEVGLQWLRWQLDAAGTYNGDPAATAGAVRVMAESFRKYVEDDGPFMRRPIAFVRTSLKGRPEPAAAAASVLALRSLQNAGDAPLVQSQAPVLLAALQRASSSAALPDLETVATVVAAARAAGIAAGGELLSVTRTLAQRGTAADDFPAFKESLQVSALLAAGAAPTDPAVVTALDAIRQKWGWWNSSASASKTDPASGPAVPAHYWYALTAALHALGAPGIEDAAGQARDWQSEIGRALVASQQFDGYWLRRDDKVAGTLAAIGALELIYGQ